MVATPAAADVILDFDNARPDASTLPAYITFTGAIPGQFAATIVGTNTPQLQEGAELQPFHTCRWRGCHRPPIRPGFRFSRLSADDLSVTNQYAPNVIAPTISGVANPNFLTRLDKYEITYTPASGTPGTPQYVPASGGANLSASDFFGIPLQLQTKGGAQPTTLTWSYNDAVNTAAVFRALGALEDFQTDTVSNTLGAIVANGANGVTINTPNGPLNGVVRIISPTQHEPSPQQIQQARRRRTQTSRTTSTILRTLTSRPRLPARTDKSRKAARSRIIVSTPPSRVLARMPAAL